MKYWWVNQNQTYKYQIRDGYMWSPKRNSNKSKNYYYDTMAKTNFGDVVFSYKGTFVMAIGVVAGPARTGTKPSDFEQVDTAWGSDGWYVPVVFEKLRNPIRPKDHWDDLRPTLPEERAPLRENGDGKQNLYLTNVPQAMAETLSDLLGGQVEAIVEATKQKLVQSGAEDANAEELINRRDDISETEKIQLTKARRGQGKFRERVMELEKSCRVTGVAQAEHLRASHIKPWKYSNDAEKLDGNNGLMLSPHVDHLFDRGYISFEQDGTVLLSPKMDAGIMNAWDLGNLSGVGQFRSAQQVYLRFHRDKVLKK
jgi:putative restriction endonuclease